jgi:hypothetical protein
MNEHIPQAIVISIVLVLLTTAIFYEILRLVLKIISRRELSERPLMLLLVVAIFSAHTIAIWTYGTAYWLLAHFGGFEPLSGVAPDSSNMPLEHFFSYIYFSAATYSSLGIGDVFPHGALQFITGVEVLNGLMLIGWSVTFTYFAVEQLWVTHGPAAMLKSINKPLSQKLTKE